MRKIIRFLPSREYLLVVFLGLLIISIGLISSNVSEVRDPRPKAAVKATVWKSPSSVVSEGGSKPWINPNNAKNSDNSYSVTTSDGGIDFSSDLKATGFGFTTAGIPSGSTINGIEVRIELHADSATLTKLFLVKLEPLFTGSSKSPNLIISTSDKYVYLGGSNDSWNKSFTTAEIFGQNFGVAFFVQIEGGSSVFANHVQMKIHYSDPPLKPTASISADDTSIAYNTSTRIRWSSNNASSCSVSPTGWTGTSGNKPTGNLTSSKTYSIFCTGAGGITPTKSVTVSVGSKSSGLDPESDPNPDPDPPPLDDGGGTPLPPPPGGGLPSLPPPPPGVPGVAAPIDPDIVNILKINLSVSYLLGNLKSPLIVGGFAQDLELKPGQTDYEVDVRGAKFALGKTLNIQIGGNKALIKKLKLKTKAPKQPVKFGSLYLGDINRDNRINQKDIDSYLLGVVTQDKSSDVNADGIVNSLDWAILLINFGKNGSR